MKNVVTADFFEMSSKLLVLNHSLRTQFFKQIKKELQSRNKDVYIFYGPKDVNDFFIKNNEVFLPKSSKLLNKKIKPEFLKKVQKLEISCPQSFSRLLLSCERDIGFHYRSGNYIFPDTMNFRKIQRDSFVKCFTSSFELVERVLTKLKPKIILSGCTNTIYHALFFFLSKKLKIPFYINRRSKILFDRFYWTSKFNMFNENNKTFKSISKPSKFSKDYLIKFRNKQQTVSYIKQNWNTHEDIISEQFKYLLQLIVHNFIAIFDKKYFKIRFFSRLKYFMFLINNKFFLKNYFKVYSTNELKKKKYCYYPLHKEPEIALNFLASHLSDQSELIKFLSMSVPVGYKLLIKEHRFNHLRRSKEFYKKLNKFYNVEVISPHDDQFKYILNAKVVITDNGTSGWESILLNIPMINLCDTFYDLIAKNKTKDISKIDSLIKKLIFTKTKKPNNDEICKLIDAEKKNTFINSNKGIIDSLFFLLGTKH